MATITTTTSLSFDAAASLTVGVDKHFEGSIAFTSANDDVWPSFTVTKPQNKTYGPFGIAMTVVITVGNGSLDYTINGGMGGFSYDTDGNVTGLASGDGNGFALPQGIRNPGALAAWRLRRAKASESNARPPVVSVIADSLGLSVTSGTTADATTAPQSWVTKCSAIVNARLGIATPPQVYNAHDSRLTLGGGAAIGTSVGYIGRNVAIQSGAHTITTPSFSFTSFEAWYYESNGTLSDVDTGVFSVNIDAAGAASITDGAVYKTYKQFAPTDVSAGAHTAVLAHVSGANYIVGVMGYTKSQNGSGVAFHRCALSGAAVVDAISGGGVTSALTGQGPTRVTAAWGAQGNPDLVIIAFGHNDATYYTPAQYSTYLDTVLAQIGTTTPVLLMSPPFPPVSQLSGTYGLRSDYWAVQASKAVAGSNVAHIRWSEYLGTGALADAAGMYYDYSTTVHQSDRGYAGWAGIMADVILG